ncbi:hypothetical protein IFM89_022144 [Coptis chinensis]|uniref:Uncharacterized protein n=1 Tax=Coptis chinensis TaxID=261450 RepID=A0A835IZ79_9MAGN|nr:hypothetical protein IFM89_022144 [Coptis chinensis]
METQKDVVTQMDVGPLQPSKRRQIRHISVAEPHPNVDINGARVRKKNRTNTESSIRSDIGAQGSFDLQTRPQAVIGAQLPIRNLVTSRTISVVSHAVLSADTARAMSSPRLE